VSNKFLWYNFGRVDREGSTIRGLGYLVHEGMLAQQEEEAKSNKIAQSAQESKVHSAHVAQRERGSDSGGKKDKCKKGKSCGASCIFYNDECLVIFPDPGVQEGLSKFRDYLRDRVEKGSISSEEAEKVFKKYAGLEDLKDQERDLKSGKVTKSGSSEWDEELKSETQKQEIRKRAQELTEAYSEMGKAYPDPKEREKAFNRTVDGVLETAFGVKNPGAAVSEREVEGIYRLQGRIKAASKVYENVLGGKIKTAEQMRDALKEVAEGYRVNKVSDAEVKLAMAFMPAEARTFLGKAGSVAEGGHFPIGSKSDVIPTSFGPVQKANTEQQRGRAELLVRIGLESGWRDIYTGEKIPLLESDLEHIIPASHGGKLSEQGYNYGLTKSRLNRGKSEGSPDYFDLNNPNGYFYASPTGKQSSKKREQLTFDEQGRLTPRGKELHSLREASGGTKADLENKLLSKAIKPVDAIKMVEESGLPADKRSKLLGKIISFWTEGSARTVAIGMQSAKEGTMARAAQPWYWYGGPTSAGGNPAGKKIAEKVAELESKGDTEGLKKLGALLGKAQRQLLDLNEQDWKGTKIRDLEMSAETGSRAAISGMIKDIRDGILGEISAL
jgi:hypothetical protein